MSVPAEANRRLIRRLYLDILNTGDLDAALDFFHPDVVDHRIFPGLPRGLDNILEGARILRRAFPDLHFTVEDLVAEGDTVVARWVMRGTHLGDLPGRAATGRPAQWSGITAFRMTAGRIVERWLYADEVSEVG